MALALNMPEAVGGQSLLHLGLKTANRPVLQANKSFVTRNRLRSCLTITTIHLEQLGIDTALVQYSAFGGAHSVHGGTRQTTRTDHRQVGNRKLGHIQFRMSQHGPGDKYGVLDNQWGFLGALPQPLPTRQHQSPFSQACFSDQSMPRLQTEVDDRRPRPRSWFIINVCYFAGTRQTRQTRLQKKVCVVPAPAWKPGMACSRSDQNVRRSGSIMPVTNPQVPFLKLVSNEGAWRQAGRSSIKWHHVVRCWDMGLGTYAFTQSYSTTAQVSSILGFRHLSGGS